MQPFHYREQEIAHLQVEDQSDIYIFAFEDWQTPLITFIDPGKTKFSALLAVFKAIKKAKESKRAVILCNGGGAIADKLICIINATLLKQALKIVYFDPFTTSSNKIRKAIARLMLVGTNKIIVWSKGYVDNFSKHLDLQENRFQVLPYKSNHSKKQAIDIPQGNYLFAGGNSARDYPLLIEAARGLDIQVVISTSQTSGFNALDIPDNVIIVQAREPYFSRLMAGCRFVVLPLKKSLIRGAGEQTICNAMFHGKAVVAVDEISASDYIEDGINGYVVKPGDSQGLRRAIDKMLNNPEIQSHMAKEGPRIVQAFYRHEHFRHRIINVCHKLYG